MAITVRIAGEGAVQMRLVMTTLIVSLWYSVVLSGCATMMGEGHPAVTIDSSPSGAEIYMDGTKLGVTPLTVQLKGPPGTELQGKDEKRISKHDFVARKGGFEDQKFWLEVRMNPWARWNFVFITALIGTTSMAVDEGNGVLYEYVPNQYFITLVPVKASQVEKEPLAKQIRLRNFVLSSYANLQSDLARGGGEYVASLNALLRSLGSTPTADLTELHRISMQHPRVPAFAEAIVEHVYSQEIPH